MNISGKYWEYVLYLSYNPVLKKIRKKEDKLMKKKLLIMLLSLSVLAGITACGGESKEETPEPESKEEEIQDIKNDKSSEPDTENDLEIQKSVDSETDINIDIDKCISDLKENLPLEPDYTFVNDYYIKADGTDLTISIVVDDATDPARALDFADTVVRQLNLYANMQDSNIALGNKDFYGGLYEKYSALVGVAQASKVNNQDEWLVFDAIVGGKTKLNLKE